MVCRGFAECGRIGAGSDQKSKMLLRDLASPLGASFFFREWSEGAEPTEERGHRYTRISQDITVIEVATSWIELSRYWCSLALAHHREPWSAQAPKTKIRDGFA